MADKEKSAELILKLYDLRRESVMREARNWYFTFNPESADDVAAVARGEHSAYYRMVTSYWDMACSLVNNGAIDEQMFNDANGEQMFVFAKIQPFIAQLREVSKNPGYLAHLEKLVMRQPEAETRLAQMREFAKRMLAARTAAATEQAEADAANA
jgi:hypothetical protein